MKIEESSIFTLNRFNVLTTLLVILNSNDANDTNFIIAKFIIEHIDEIKSMSIYDLADRCFVSRSSVQRFLKNIGYESYTQLKQSIDIVISHQKAYAAYTNRTGFPEFVAASINNMLKDIDVAASSRSFSRLVDLLYSCENVYMLSAEDSVEAIKVFQRCMLSIGRTIRIYTNASSNFDFTSSLTKDDLVIVSSGTGNFALVINDMMKPIPAHKYLLTWNTSSLFENTYDTIQYVGTSMSFNSSELTASKNVYNTYGLTYFFDLLFHAYFTKYYQR